MSTVQYFSTGNFGHECQIRSLFMIYIIAEGTNVIKIINVQLANEIYHRGGFCKMNFNK